MSLTCPFSIHASNILLIPFSVCNLFSLTTIRLRQSYHVLFYGCRSVAGVGISDMEFKLRHMGWWSEVKVLDSISAVDGHLLSDPQPRENEALAVLSLPGETKSPVGELLVWRVMSPLCLYSPPCLLTCPCCVQTVCWPSCLPPNLSLQPAPCFSRSSPAEMFPSPSWVFLCYFSWIFLHSQSHILIHSSICSPGTSSPLCLH